MFSNTSSKFYLQYQPFRRYMELAKERFYLVWSTAPGCIHERAAASCEEDSGSSFRLVTGPRGWW